MIRPGSRDSSYNIRQGGLVDGQAIDSLDGNMIAGLATLRFRWILGT